MPLRGATPAYHWFKVVLEQRAASGDWVLATQTTSLQDVRFYGPFDASGTALAPPVHTGLAQPFATRPLGSERYLTRLQPPGPGTYTVYARLYSETAPSFDLSVWDTAEYLQWRQHKRLFDGICYGILIALLVYNLTLVGIFRDSTYTFYVGQCIFALLTLATFNGHTAHYLWGDAPWWQERSYFVLPSLWLLFGALFTRSFLDTRQTPLMDGVLVAIGLLAALTAVLGGLGQFAIAQTQNELLASAGIAAASLAAILVLRRGFTPARWYLGAQALLFVTVACVVLSNWKVIDAPFMLANGLQIGVAAEMVVFAVALSTRIDSLNASQIALRLRADHLAKAATTDPLTGLTNRMGLTQGATQLLSEGGTHALLLLDLDRFKPINDTYGHDAGDEVLRAVATRLQTHTRSGDIVARLGGDEFVVMLAHAPAGDALTALVKHLELAICQPVYFQHQELCVGVSTGVAHSPQDGPTLTELMRCADQRMYQAKQAHKDAAQHPAAPALPLA
ncbi:diguanylate cyclase [Diaphorobacter sp.]|uniref:diguanylate cyclase n=1 Tax=Diaphorobacter sp. TaxID=1934310 RepID=UPI002587985F|nr:diguanylate cyclase [Diaphorobacter sp.]